MYIYHFWPLCMHCQKTTTIRCFLEATYDLLVVLRKPWICTLCFDALFSKFRDFDDFWSFLIEKWRTSDSLLSKSPDISAFNPKDPLRTCSKPCYFDLILTILDPFWGSWREVAVRPRTSCLWAGGPVWSPLKPCPGPQILVILTTFPIEKVNFCHFAYQGSVKMPFWPYFDPFWALLSRNLGLLPKCAYLGPLPWRDLGGPSGTLFWPYFDHFGPLLRVLERLQLDPVQAAFGLEDLTSSPSMV